VYIHINLCRVKYQNEDATELAQFSAVAGGELGLAAVVSRTCETSAAVAESCESADGRRG
jgi:hypothetical protein